MERRGEERILNAWRGENTECLERRILNAWRGENTECLERREY
jgi:hypothetical protein